MTTKFESFVGQELANYDNGQGDMAHDVLYRIEARWVSMFGELPESDWE